MLWNEYVLTDFASLVLSTLFNLALPGSCMYHSVLSDECLHVLWVNETKCVEMGTAYPLSMDRNLKLLLYNNSNLREALKIMAVNSTDQMECYGFGMVCH